MRTGKRNAEQCYSDVYMAGSKAQLLREKILTLISFRNKEFLQNLGVDSEAGPGHHDRA